MRLEPMDITASRPRTAFVLAGGLQSELARYASQAELIVLPAANPGHVQPTDFDHADELIGAALQAARSALDATPVLEPLAA